MEATSWSTFFSNVTAFFNLIRLRLFGSNGTGGWINSIVSCITGNPIILLFFLICLVGIGIGMFKRLMRLH